MQDMPTTGRRLVWDLPTRVFHWALAGSFLGAYLLAEQDGARTIHVMFGYTVAALVAFRLLWGFVGGSHSRFSDFAYGPREAVRYLRDLVTGRARDYEGHNPAGSWAIFGLLMLAAATAATGWLHYNGIGGEALEESHELLANAWLAMVFVHLAGLGARFGPAGRGTWLLDVGREHWRRFAAGRCRGRRRRTLRPPPGSTRLRPVSSRSLHLRRSSRV